MPPDQPNVLWICTDQQRYDTLGCYGNDRVSTPVIDGFAAEGTLFERAYCQNPVCTPSRASMLTGRYPRTTRCRQNGQPFPREETLVPRVFADAGYETGFVGKLHLSPVDSSAPASVREPARRVDDGYAVRRWSHNHGAHPANEYQAWLRDHGVEYETRPALGSDYVREGMPPEHHQTTWCAERAADFIEQNADDPWLYSVNIFDPHPGFDAPEGFLDRYDLDDVPLPNFQEGELDDKPVFQRDKHRGTNNRGGPTYVDLDERDHRAIRAAYWAMCDLIDDGIGRMLEALEETDQREDTIVVFTSDHGTMLGDHGLYAKGPYFYEPGVRVPLILGGPDIPSGRSIEDVVELVDIAPTILERAGLEAPGGVQGESLWPLLDGSADERRKSGAYCEFYNSSTQHTDPKAYATMLRTDRYKLVSVHGRDEGELYDLEKDPSETVNRWGDPAFTEVKADLLDRLTDRMARTADPLPEREGRW